jgi:CRISPR-associated Csx2 family protein
MEDNSMARVYISFLGTTNYLECYYYRGVDSTQSEPDYPVRFVQEATILQNCKDWGPGDQIIIFTTKDAEEANWKDHGHRDRETGQPLKGLDTCLQKLSLQVPFENRPIPEGHSQDQVWQIFQQVFKALQIGDEVVFDITHAFRSIPLMTIVALQYAKIMRKVSLRGIYYGAFEILGDMQKARKIVIQHRKAPIIDLTSLNSLMDWSIATDRFLESGDVKSAGALARTGVQGILKETRGANQAAQAIKRLGVSLEKFSKMLSTCRGPEISSATMELKANAGRCKVIDLPEPFRPLFEKIQERLDSFSGDSLRDGLAAVRWCADHNLIQQGFTILEEILFTYIVAGVGHDPLDETVRKIASQAFAIIRKGLIETPALWHKPSKEHPDITLKITNFILEHTGMDKIGHELQPIRNDLNHAGFGNKKRTLQKADLFAKNLKKLLAETEKMVKDHR